MTYFKFCTTEGFSITDLLHCGISIYKKFFFFRWCFSLLKVKDFNRLLRYAGKEETHALLMPLYFLFIPDVHVIVTTIWKKSIFSFWIELLIFKTINLIWSSTVAILGYSGVHRTLRAGTELAVHGLYKNDRGPIFPKGQHSVLLK